MCGVPNKRAARLLTFGKKSLPICLIWTYTFIKFWKFFPSTQLFEPIFFLISDSINEKALSQGQMRPENAFK